MELNYYRRLRELREDHDYSQADIGKRLGMSKQQYFLYEADRACGSVWDKRGLPGGTHGQSIAPTAMRRP